MLRRTSSIQQVLVYATFLTLSVMIHMVLVWPRRELPSLPGSGATAPVSSEDSATRREASEGASSASPLPDSAPASQGLPASKATSERLG